MYIDPLPCKYLNPPVVLFLLFLLSESNIGACDDPVDDHIGAYQTPEFNTGACSEKQALGTHTLWAA